MNRRAEWGDEHARRSAEVCLEDTLDDMQFEGRFGNFTFTPTKNGTIEFKQKRVSSQKFEEQTLRRFEQYEQRRKEKLLVQKKEHMKLELTPFTMEPSINDQKRKEPKRNPLISRLDEILESRKIKIEGKKNSFVSKAEKEAKECTFHPNINSSNAVNRSVDDLFRWQEKRNRRLMEKSMDTQYNKRECSFTPEISKQSRRLVKKREHNKEFKKVEDRLLGYIKKNKTASLAQTSQPSICQQRTSIDQRAATCNLSILETKDNEGFSPKKEQNNKVVCVMQDEMEAVYKSLPKIDKFEDCNKELMFSFKKFLNSTNQDLPKSTDRETSHEYLKYGPHKGDLIYESDKAFESTESRDFEKETELILKNRKEELRKRKEEKLKEEVSRNKSKPRELSFRALKRSTLSPLREVAPDLNGGYTGANKKSGPEDLAQPTSITSNEETKPKKVPARKSTRTRSTTPTPKPGVHTSIEQTKQEVKVASRHAHLKEAPSLDRPSTGLHKPNRNEMIEKYGVKVKQPNLECSEIQQTVFAGDTTSMLQNLKKLNTNLRMCSNLQCIIKKKDQLVGTENAPVTTKLGGVPIKEQKENLKAPANALHTKFSERGSHDRNPFIELVNSQVHKPFN